MGAFEYRQAQEIRDVFQRHGVRYLFIVTAVQISGRSTLDGLLPNELAS
jgi:hypothetical protein